MPYVAICGPYYTRCYYCIISSYCVESLISGTWEWLRQHVYSDFTVLQTQIILLLTDDVSYTGISYSTSAYDKINTSATDSKAKEPPTELIAAAR